MLSTDGRLEEMKAAIRTHALVTSSQSRIISADEISLAPWLIDFRALLLQPKWLKLYADLFWDTFEDNYPFQVCGMESAAISLVTAIVLAGDARGKPVNGLFLRKSRKRSGLMRRIEGAPNGHPVILVDDLINRGRTFATQIATLEKEGLAVGGLFSLLSYWEAETYEQLFPGKEFRALLSLRDIGLSIEAPPAAPPPFETIWRFQAPGAAYNYVVQKSAPAIDRHRVYVGSDAGTFYSLDKQDGRIIWQFQTGKHPEGKGIFSTPAIYKDTVYFGAYDGNVYALDTKNGELRWKYEDADWVGSSPALAPDKGLVYIGLEFGFWRKHGGIVALDMKTGTRRWQDRTPAYTHGSPLYIKEKHMVIIGSNDNIVSAYHAVTGMVLWRYRASGSVKSSFAYDAARDLIYFGTLGGSFYALNSDGVPVFGRPLYGGMYSTPLVHKGIVYAASLDKSVHAFDHAGKELWSFDTQGRIFASPVIAEGSLFIGSNDGCLYEIDPKTGKGHVVFHATERIVNAIAYDDTDRRFFVPTHGGEVVCLTRGPIDLGQTTHGAAAHAQ